MADYHNLKTNRIRKLFTQKKKQDSLNNSLEKVKYLKKKRSISIDLRSNQMQVQGGIVEFSAVTFKLSRGECVARDVDPYIQ